MTFREVESELLTNPDVRSLCKAFICCSDDEQLFLRFLRDILSFEEIRNAAKRWVIAQQLIEGKSQRQIAEELNISTKTVGNMARWTTGHSATGGLVTAYARISHSEESDA